MSVAGYMKRLIGKAKRKRKKKDPWAKEYIDILHSYTLHPNDKPYFEKLIYKNKDFRYALKCDRTAEFDTAFEFGNQPERNFIYELIEPQGRGKTRGSLHFAKRVQKLHPNSQFIFVYDLDDAIEQFGNQKPHYTIVIDENLKLTGEGSRTVWFNFLNLVAMCREFEVNLIFNVQEFIKMKNVDAYLQILGWDTKTETTRVMWRDRDGDCSGLVYLKKNYTNAELKEIAKIKRKKWKSMAKNKGTHKTKYAKVTKKDITLVEDKIKEELETSGLFTTDAIEIYIETEFPGLSDMKVKKIARYLHGKYKKLDELKRETERELTQQQAETGNYLVDKKPIQSWIDLGFKNLVFSMLSKYLTSEELELYKDICTKEGYRSIADRKFGSSQDIAQLTDLKKKVQENYLGEKGGEHTFKAYLDLMGLDYEYYGSNTREPDFIVHSWREVISFKCYTLRNPSKARHHIGAKEQSAALRLGYKLFLLVYTMRQGIFEKYSVLLMSTLQVPPEGLKNEVLRSSQAETPPLPSRIPAPTPAHATLPTLGGGGAGGVLPEVVDPVPKKKRRRRR